MYVYVQSESCLWTVGFYDPNSRWNADSDHSSKEEAAQRVHYLNGGNLQPREHKDVPEFPYGEFDDGKHWQGEE